MKMLISARYSANRISTIVQDRSSRELASSISRREEYRVADLSLVLRQEAQAETEISKVILHAQENP